MSKVPPPTNTYISTTPPRLHFSILVFPPLPLSYLLDKAVIFPHPLALLFSSPHIPLVFSFSLALSLDEAKGDARRRRGLNIKQASPALQTRLFTINFRFVLNYLISVGREIESVGEEGAQVVGVGWVLLQGRGEVVTLLVLQAQLSYGLIMLGNEKKKATGLLDACSLSQAVPGWIGKAHGSDGSSRRPR